MSLPGTEHVWALPRPSPLSEGPQCHRGAAGRRSFWTLTPSLPSLSRFPPFSLPLSLPQWQQPPPPPASPRVPKLPVGGSGPRAAALTLSGELPSRPLREAAWQGNYIFSTAIGHPLAHDPRSVIVLSGNARRFYLEPGEAQRRVYR